MSAVLPEDAALFCKWAEEQRQDTDFDPGVVGYPRACMTKAMRDGQTIAMVPLHPVLMMESLIKDPNLTKTQTAATLFKLGELMEQVAKDSGHGECFFITNSKKEADMCEKHKGWIKVMYDPSKKTYLMKRKICK